MGAWQCQVASGASPDTSPTAKHEHHSAATVPLNATHDSPPAGLTAKEKLRAAGSAVSEMRTWARPSRRICTVMCLRGVGLRCWLQGQQSCLIVLHALPATGGCKQAAHRQQLPTSRASTSLCSRSRRPQNSSCASCGKGRLTRRMVRGSCKRVRACTPEGERAVLPGNGHCGCSLGPMAAPCMSKGCHTCWKAPWNAAEWASSARFRLAGVM